jgi:hypothetical protein
MTISLWAPSLTLMVCDGFGAWLAFKDIAKR